MPRALVAFSHLDAIHMRHHTLKNFTSTKACTLTLASSCWFLYSSPSSSFLKWRHNMRCALGYLRASNKHQNKFMYSLLKKKCKIKKPYNSVDVHTERDKYTAMNKLGHLPEKQSRYCNILQIQNKFSQNHQIVGVGGDLQRPPNPTSMLKQVP